MRQQHRILIIGSSGYLGRVVTAMLASRHSVIPTHNKNPYFPNSTRYSFPHDDLTDLAGTNRVDICILPAEIEKNQADCQLDDLDFFRQAVEKLVQPFAATRFVYISSDGIFDGQQGLYTESGDPQPTTDYGQKLKICEDTIRALCANYCIVRPSYLYGHALNTLDSRLQKTTNICQSQQEAVYFEDMFKSPLHVIDAAELITTLAFSEYVGVVNIGGPRMSVYDFHNEAMKALSVSGRISAKKMPADAGYLRDTSLDVTLCTKLTGFVPKSVAESFSLHLGKTSSL